MLTSIPGGCIHPNSESRFSVGLSSGEDTVEMIEVTLGSVSAAVYEEQGYLCSLIGVKRGLWLWM